MGSAIGFDMGSYWCKCIVTTVCLVAATQAFANQPSPEPVAPEPDVRSFGESCNALNPYKRVAPKYPESARAMSQDGWAVSRVDLSERGGRPDKVEVLRSSPRKLFDQPTAVALANWLFRPAAENASCFVLIEYKMKAK